MRIEENFGTWLFDQHRLTLEHMGDPMYNIDLESITSAAEVLDWIFQIEEKSWATDAEIADFVRAIEYLFGRGICGGGINNQIDTKALLKQRFQN
jgi:hypothetical protein